MCIYSFDKCLFRLGHFKSAELFFCHFVVKRLFEKEYCLFFLKYKAKYKSKIKGINNFRCSNENVTENANRSDSSR